MAHVDPRVEWPRVRDQRVRAVRPPERGQILGEPQLERLGRNGRQAARHAAECRVALGERGGERVRRREVRTDRDREHGDVEVLARHQDRIRVVGRLRLEVRLLEPHAEIEALLTQAVGEVELGAGHHARPAGQPDACHPIPVRIELDADHLVAQPHRDAPVPQRQQERREHDVSHAAVELVGDVPLVVEEHAQHHAQRGARAERPPVGEREVVERVHRRRFRGEPPRHPARRVATEPGPIVEVLHGVEAAEQDRVEGAESIGAREPGRDPGAPPGVEQPLDRWPQPLAQLLQAGAQRGPQRSDVHRSQAVGRHDGRRDRLEFEGLVETPPEPLVEAHCEGNQLREGSRRRALPGPPPVCGQPETPQAPAAGSEGVRHRHGVPGDQRLFPGQDRSGVSTLGVPVHVAQQVERLVIEAHQHVQPVLEHTMALLRVPPAGALAAEPGRALVDRDRVALIRVRLAGERPGRGEPSHPAAQDRDPHPSVRRHGRACYLDPASPWSGFRPLSRPPSREVEQELGIPRREIEALRGLVDQRERPGVRTLAALVGDPADRALQRRAVLAIGHGRSCSRRSSATVTCTTSSIRSSSDAGLKVWLRPAQTRRASATP